MCDLVIDVTLTETGAATGAEQVCFGRSPLGY
jgi:hypothetical protein